MRRAPTRRHVFEHIYKKNIWASTETKSGCGSTLAATEGLRARLPELLVELGATSILDAPCGDWNWMQEVVFDDVLYIGLDIVPAIIRANRARFGQRKNVQFFIRDIVTDEIPKADVALCRDALTHLSNAEARQALDNLLGARSLLATHDPNVGENIDIITGNWRPVNLTLPPFNLREPDMVLLDDPRERKMLGLWRTF